jgi:hypothetical protein
MNKYLMLSAAAVFAATGANAGTFQHSFQFGTSGGTSYCDGGSVYTSGSSVWAWQHTNADCAGATTEGQGLLGKLNATGKSADMSDTYLGQLYGIFSEQLGYVLPKKLANGKPWELYIGLNGTTSFLGNSGVLVNVNGAQHKGGKSTAAGLKQLISVHKAAMHKN